MCLPSATLCRRTNHPFSKATKPATPLRAKIAATDKEIDCLVYDLYDLTDDEIAIVEGQP